MPGTTHSPERLAELACKSVGTINSDLTFLHDDTTKLRDKWRSGGRSAGLTQQISYVVDELLEALDAMRAVDKLLVDVPAHLTQLRESETVDNTATILSILGQNRATFEQAQSKEYIVGVMMSVSNASSTFHNALRGSIETAAEYDFRFKRLLEYILALRAVAIETILLLDREAEATKRGDG